jgi:hypothetical protein
MTASSRQTSLMLRNSILAVIAQGIGFDGFGVGSTMRRWRS